MPPPPPPQLYSISFSFPNMVDLYCVESCDVDLLPAHMILEKKIQILNQNKSKYSFWSGLISEPPVNINLMISTVQVSLHILTYIKILPYSSSVYCH